MGDDILAYLEEVEYLKACCTASLDFSKAYDRLTKHWLMQCMGALGLGPSAQRWVQLLHSQLTARVQLLAISRDPRGQGIGIGQPTDPAAVRQSSTAVGSLFHRPISMLMTPHCMSGFDRTCTQLSSPACFPFVGLQGHPSMPARLWPCCLERQ